MKIDPLFELFEKYSSIVKQYHPDSIIYFNITAEGKGYVDMVENGELITPFGWESCQEGIDILTEYLDHIEIQI